MMEAATVDAPYLLTRKQATVRYNISLWELQHLYKSDPEFPVLRVGRKVLVHRDEADAYFMRNIREVIEVE